MPQLTQDKIIRSAINELDHLPEGFDFNSHKTWSEISRQISQKKKAVIKWQYAAALITLALTAYFFLLSKNEVKQVLPDLSNRLNIKQDVKTITYSKITRKEYPVYPKKINKKLPSARTTIKVEKEIIPSAIDLPLIAKTSEPELSNSPIINLESDLKSLTIIHAQKKVFKKYKVVHLNELNPIKDLPEDLKNFSRSDMKRAFQKTELSETSISFDLPTKQFLFFKIAQPSNTITISNN